MKNIKLMIAAALVVTTFGLQAYTGLEQPNSRRLIATRPAAAKTVAKPVAAKPVATKAVAKPVTKPTMTTKAPVATNKLNTNNRVNNRMNARTTQFNNF